jgi:hypothetical protein
MIRGTYLVDFETPGADLPSVGRDVLNSGIYGPAMLVQTIPLSKFSEINPER